MFGMADPWIAAAYILCILSSLLCVVYGWMKWNSDGDTAAGDETAKWAKEEDKISDTL